MLGSVWSDEERRPSRRGRLALTAHFRSLERMLNRLDRTQQLISRTTRYPCDPRCARTATSCSQSTGSPLRLPAGSSQARGRSLRTDQGVHCFSESALVRTALLCPSSLALPIPKLWRIPRPPHVPAARARKNPQRLPLALIGEPFIIRSYVLRWPPSTVFKRALCLLQAFCFLLLPSACATRAAPPRQTIRLLPDGAAPTRRPLHGNCCRRRFELECRRSARRMRTGCTSAVPSAELHDDDPTC